MKRTEWLQETKKMRFEEAYNGWQEKRLTQEEAARLLGVCERTFRRYIDRYLDEGLEGLIDKRIEQVSHKKAPVDEVMRLVDSYQNKHQGWNCKHFHVWYQKGGGARSYTWVKNTLQEAKAITRATAKGKHRKRRERCPLPGMMIHQDGSTHLWVPGKYWDLIVTMDDATNEHYAMFFVEQEGTWSSLQGVRKVIETRGLFSSFYSDRGSHYWHTPEAGGKVDKNNPTQFGRAMQQLGIDMIAAYSPEARGRSERAFATHQGRLPKELALTGITGMDEANHYLDAVYLPSFNKEFSHPPLEEGTAFVPFLAGGLDDIMCEQFERTVGKDNCVKFETLTLQIPDDRHRYHYVKTKVRVHRYSDGALGVFHGPRKLAHYDTQGQIFNIDKKAAA